MSDLRAPAKAGKYPVSDHCDGTVFFNPGKPEGRGLWEVIKWKSNAKRGPWPVSQPVVCAKPAAAPEKGRLRVTWIGHCTFLIEGDFGAILTDPVYAERVGPLGLLGPKRVHAPALPFAELPHIDAILLSHDHYDHCDLGTLRRLARRDAPVLVTPLGNANLGQRAGLACCRELDWWQSCQVGRGGGLELCLTPARHWSNRVTGVRNGRLWGGFYLKAGAHRLLFTGDTGYQEGLFGRIAGRLGAPDLALLPIGAFEPRWFMHPMHCSPEEAVVIHQELGAKKSLAMHWGCWPLADDAWDEGPRLLREELLRRGLGEDCFVAPLPGACLEL